VFKYTITIDKNDKTDENKKTNKNNKSMDG